MLCVLKWPRKQQLYSYMGKLSRRGVWEGGGVEHITEAPIIYVTVTSTRLQC